MVTSGMSLKSLLYWGMGGAVIGVAISTQIKDSDGNKLPLMIGAGVGGAAGGMLYLTIFANPYVRLFSAVSDINTGLKTN